MVTNIETSDPARQCTATQTDGQRCRREIYAEGCTLCRQHGGVRQLKKKMKRMTLMYNLGRFQERVTEMVENPKAKSIRSEIAILRMVLEQVFQKMDSTSSMLSMMPHVKDTTLAIGKLVQTCQTIELNMEKHLSQTDIVNLATGIVQVIGKYVEDEETVNRIKEDILKLVAAATNPDMADDEDE